MDERIYSYDSDGWCVLGCGGREVFRGILVDEWFILGVRGYLTDTEAIHYLLTGEVPRECR